MTNLTYRLATAEDSRLYFYWANDDAVRANSFSPGKIQWETHEEWFLEKVASGDTYLLVFFTGTQPVGQVRLERVGDNTLEIDVSVDQAWRGKKIGQAIMVAIRRISDKLFPTTRIKGIIQQQNIASIRSFEAAGFVKEEEVVVNDIACDVLYLH